MSSNNFNFTFFVLFILTKVTTEADGKSMSKGGQDMFKRIENSHKPFLAAIHGPALGGQS